MSPSARLDTRLGKDLCSSPSVAVTPKVSTPAKGKRKPPMDWRYLSRRFDEAGSDDAAKKPRGLFSQKPPMLECIEKNGWSAEDVMGLKTLFSLFDQDGSEMISREELELCLQSLSVGATT